MSAVGPRKPAPEDSPDGTSRNGGSRAGGDLLRPFLRQLAGFSHEMSEADRLWDILFPCDGRRWEHLRIVRYRRTFFLTLAHHDHPGLEVEPGRQPRPLESWGTACGGRGGPDWELLIAGATRWLGRVKKDWVRANRVVQRDYPQRFRYGIVPHALVRAFLPDLYRLDHDLGAVRARKFVRLVEDGHFLRRDNLERPTMTANDFFHSCRIAYLAGAQPEETIDASLSGRELYRVYADGRHEGLLDIPGHSKKAFADWIDGGHPLRTRGGHPWEIKRGGNTTHIDLTVSRPLGSSREGFVVEVRAESTGRLAEAIRMFLALHDANLPVSIADPEDVRKRILGLDNIGIVPAYAPLHRANQSFPREDGVFDVLYVSDLGRRKRRLAPFITWKPLPLLMPQAT